jgi:hypothetical protein
MGSTHGEMKESSPANHAAARETEELIEGTFQAMTRPLQL